MALSIFCIAVFFSGAWVAFLNWRCFYSAVVKKQIAPSWIPLAGGIMMFLGVFFFPALPSRHFAWLAFILDWGSVPGHVHAFVIHWRRMRRQQRLGIRRRRTRAEARKIDCTQLGRWHQPPLQARGPLDGLACNWRSHLANRCAVFVGTVPSAFAASLNAPYAISTNGCYVEGLSGRYGPAGAGPLEAKFGQNQSFEARTQLSLTTPPSDQPSGFEVFQSDLDWYAGHARSLAMSPADCCMDQGHYLVAGELFYLLLQPTSLLDGSYSQLDSEQRAALERLRHSVRQVPVEARSGGATAAESLADMRHQSWEQPRRLANELLTALAPLITMRDQHGSSTKR